MSTHSDHTGDFLKNFKPVSSPESMTCLKNPKFFLSRYFPSMWFLLIPEQQSNRFLSPFLQYSIFGFKPAVNLSRLYFVRLKPSNCRHLQENTGVFLFLTTPSLCLNPLLPLMNPREEHIFHTKVNFVVSVDFIVPFTPLCCHENDILFLYRQSHT